jgi:hypothetical protein
MVLEANRALAKEFIQKQNVLLESLSVSIA